MGQRKESRFESPRVADNTFTDTRLGQPLLGPKVFTRRIPSWAFADSVAAAASIVRFPGKHFSKCPFDASHGILTSRRLFSAVNTAGSSRYDLQGIANVVVHQSDGP
jgi:hypothetical protein